MNHKLNYEIEGFNLAPLDEIYLEKKLKHFPLNFFKISFDGQKYKFETTFCSEKIILRTSEFQVLIQLIKNKISMLHQRQMKSKRKKKKYKYTDEQFFVDDLESKKEL